MAAQFGQQNLWLYQGDDWAGWVTVLNSDGSTPDLTGYTAQSEIRQGPADQSWLVCAELTCTVVPPNNVSLSLTSVQTTLLRWPNYVWDMQLTAPDGTITTVLAGQVTVVPEVTREWVDDEDQLALVWVREPYYHGVYWTEQEELARWR